MAKLTTSAMEVATNMVEQDDLNKLVLDSHLHDCAQTCVWYERCPEQKDRCSNRTNFICHKYREEVFLRLAANKPHN